MSGIQIDRNYANGDCQILAAAIQKLTGWDIALFEGAGSHVTAIAPNGLHIDVNGARTEAEIAAQWEAPGAQIIGHIDDLGWLGTGWDDRDLIAAGEALDRAGLLTDDIRQTIAWETE